MRKHIADTDIVNDITSTHQNVITHVDIKFLYHDGDVI